MGVPPLSEEQCKAVIEAYERTGTKAVAAAELGIPVSTFKGQLARAYRRGFGKTDPVMPGFHITRVSTHEDAEGNVLHRSIQQKPEPGGEFELPEGHAIKGVSAYLDADGRVVSRWVKTKEGERDPLWVAGKIKEAFEGIEFTIPPVPAPENTDADCISLFPAADLHMGLYVWGDEAAENWNLEKADRTYRQTFADLVAMTPRNKTAIILGGGDQMHADNSENRTARSGNNLDVDGRYERVLETTCNLFLHFAALALQTHENVVLRILKGNHDQHSSAAIAYFLKAAFRNEPRVVVDTSPNLFWVYQFGKVMLVSTHGHEAKAAQIPGIMAARWPKIWGETVYRHAHTFHIHHRTKLVQEDGGAVVETHQSPAPADAFHWGHGYNSGRSMRSIVYHKEHGEFGGATRPVVAT